MARRKQNDIFPSAPVAMIDSLAADAGRDADRVNCFLDQLGLGASPENPRPMPPTEFLNRLRFGLRFLDWESKGIFIHRDAGLPAAHDVIRDAFLSVTDPKGSPTELGNAVRRLSVERFAWNGL